MIDLKDLFSKLEKESAHINPTNGIKKAMDEVLSLKGYESLVAHCQEHKRDSLKILEKIEEISERQVDSRYPNPNDSFAFVLLTTLLELPNNSNSGCQSYLAAQALEKMQNSFFSPEIRQANFLERLEEISQISSADAMDELHHVMGDLLVARNFKKVNDILIKMDVTKFGTGILYAMVNFTSKYINQLPFYKEFFSKAREEFIKHPKKDDLLRTEEEVDKFLGRFKDGFLPLYDPEKDIQYKSHEEKFSETIDAKIAFAKEIGDKDLENIITYYKIGRERDLGKEKSFRTLRHRIGDAAMNEDAVIALRAFADKIEQRGMHFMVHAELPFLPIFGQKDNIEAYSSHIQITMVRGPLGG